MRGYLIGAAALAASLGAAQANDTMDAMTGASVTYTYADGTEIVATYSDDGTYTTDSAGGGKWTIDGDELCITTEAGQSGCTMLDGGMGAGDSWEAVDAFGNPVTITIG
ncbi:MAG: hypothetical protein AAGC56_06925 [Pseudomonadota bacterium]